MLGLRFNADIPYRQKFFNWVRFVTAIVALSGLVRILGHHIASPQLLILSGAVGIVGSLLYLIPLKAVDTTFPEKDGTRVSFGEKCVICGVAIFFFIFSVVVIIGVAEAAVLPPEVGLVV